MGKVNDFFGWLNKKMEEDKETTSDSTEEMDIRTVEERLEDKISEGEKNVVYKEGMRIKIDDNGCQHIACDKGYLNMTRELIKNSVIEDLVNIEIARSLGKTYKIEMDLDDYYKNIRFPKGIIINHREYKCIDIVAEESTKKRVIVTYTFIPIIN